MKTEKEIRDAIDTLREEIALDYVHFDAHKKSADDMRSALDTIIMACKEAQKLCYALEHIERQALLESYNGKRELLRGYAGCDKWPCYPRGEQCVVCCHRVNPLP